MEYLYNKYYNKRSISSNLNERISLMIDYVNEPDKEINLQSMTNLKNLLLVILKFSDIPYSLITELNSSNLQKLEIKGTCSLDGGSNRSRKILTAIAEEKDGEEEKQEAPLLHEITIKTEKIYIPEIQRKIDLLNNLPVSLIELHFECVPLNDVFDTVLHTINNLHNLKTLRVIDSNLSKEQVEQINKLISK
jgi:hypothetical protein